jgi:pyruvate ferredoxin oxidoreductase gamma subunit
MYQIRIHGRGGQGVVSGAEMLSVAAFLEGRYALAGKAEETVHA